LSTATTKQPPKIQPRPVQKTVNSSVPDAVSQQTADAVIETLPPGMEVALEGSIQIDLGLSRLIPIDPKAYCSAHAQIEMTEPARVAMKRLSLTLASSGERLSSGKVVGTSVANAIVWLCEKLAESAN
jgi:hypothetical protein